MRTFVLGVLVGVGFAFATGPLIWLVALLWALVDHDRFERLARDIGSTYTDAVASIAIDKKES